MDDPRDDEPEEGGRVGPPLPVAGWLDRAAAVSWRFLAVAGALAVLGWLFSKLFLLVLPLAAALIASTLLVPPARWLERRGLSRTAATTVVVVVTVVVLLGLFAFAGLRFAAQADDLVQQLQDVRRQVVSWLKQGPLQLSEQRIQDIVDRIAGAGNGGRFVSGIMSGTVKLIEAVAAALLTLVLLFFFVRDGDRMSAWIMQRLPPRHRERYGGIGASIWETLGWYFRGVVLIGIIDAVPVGITLLALGVPLVLPLTLLIFFGAFIPIVGAFVSGLAAVLVAAATQGLVAALIVLAVIVTVQQVEGHIIYPVLMGHRLPLHPVAILVALTAGGLLAGIAGAALAVPVAAALTVAGHELRVQREGGADRRTDGLGAE